jgi:hypothetical protein
MDTLRLDVSLRGKDYVAESHAPALSALGPSAEEAAENGRLMAIALFAQGTRPAMLIVCCTQPGLSTIVMQPIGKCVSLSGARGKANRDTVPP